ncbi:AraC family transcriptional regulator [Paenibacillus sp. FSL R7-269]|uniref:AraC family transcriptional regulator n=1 Tax=Paenibacillus sp. FSL R7-269 TaxID=1226755 RepID=UPI0003E1CB40|nr:AraC family transcriptional regulator [Paenibacillus sp. FSL R7-269]ETT49764.1 AraC family transcriptional regulator [Paenibacillus sp. FSL R7-269]
MDDSLRTGPLLQQLAALILRHAPSAGTRQTLIPSLQLMHATDAAEPLESVYKPSICVVAQGAKAATLSGETFHYDPSTYLVTSVELPINGRITGATSEHPFLGIKLSFDPGTILEIVKEMADSPLAPGETSLGITVARTSEPLLEAIVRLIQLLDAPQDIPVLSPLVIREILYRVLQSDQGAHLHQFAIIGSHAHRIAEAIQVITKQYDQSLIVEQLAESVNMSTSAFHKHFKRVTAMSPLQYQKVIRLQEARRLMLTESLQASDAAFRVGYESPSQFSREYTRQYGRPPVSDVQGILGLSK